MDSILNSSLINNVSKQPQQLHSKNGRPHSLNEPHVIITPNFWGEARLVS